MSTTGAKEYLRRAEECERLAGACIAKANRKILLYVAASWRRMAGEVGESGSPLARHFWPATSGPID
jgi:hypothetical protein